MVDTPNTPPTDSSTTSSEETKRLKGALLRFVNARFDLHEDAAYEGQTLESVRPGVPFKGANLWVLMFAILICSIGLNVNSPAVVIGAMLISPLMGPILGIGVGVGIFDLELVLTSAKNLAIATVMSVAVSASYFYLSPLSEAQSELLARVSPTLFDVLIATFGGFVGIIAVSRKEKSNALPGVAIATALMPPICTAGYAIAYQEWYYFMGALYLFFINLVFIAFATFVLVRFMRFSRHSFVDAAQERRVKFWIYGIAAIVAVPSVYTAYTTVEESIYTNRAQRFIEQEVNFQYAKVIASKISGSRKDSTRLIEIVLIGKTVSDLDIQYLEKELADYGLENTELRVMQDADNEPGVTQAQLAILQEQSAMNALYQRKSEDLSQKEEYIQKLKEQLMASTKDTIAMSAIIEEAKVIYPEVEGIRFGRMQAGGAAVDTINELTVGAAWIIHKDPISKEKVESMARWLAVRAKLDTVLVFK